jgi:hypothetical protein
VTPEETNAWKRAQTVIRQRAAAFGVAPARLWFALQQADDFARQDPAGFAQVHAQQFAAATAGRLGAREEFLAHVLAGLGLALDARLAAVIDARARELRYASRQQQAALEAARPAADKAAASLQAFAARHPDFHQLRGRIEKLMLAADRAGREISLEQAYEQASSSAA